MRQSDRFGPDTAPAQVSRLPPRTRRRLQVVFLVLAHIPTTTSLMTLAVGSARFVDAAAIDVPLDNTYRYLGGIYLAVALLVLWCVPQLEQRIEGLVFASGAIFLGAVGRLVSIVDVGSPGAYIWFVLVLELGLLPFTLLLRQRVHTLERARGA